MESPVLFGFNKSSEEGKRVIDLLGLEDPWPLEDVLRKLKWATDYLLINKSYDGQNHEELQQCSRRAEEILGILEDRKKTIN